MGETPEQIVVPFGPQHPLDPDHLAQLIAAVFLVVPATVLGAPVEESDWEVFRRSSNPQVSYSGRRLKAPHYRRSIWSVRERITKAAPSVELMNYLWQAGHFQKSMHSTDSASELREAWDDYTWSMLLFNPLLHLLARSAARQLTEDFVYEPWSIDQDDAIEASRSLAALVCNGVRRVRALCPVLYGHAEGVLSTTLAPGVEMRGWSVEERCLFLTRYHHEYHDDDLSSWSSHALLQIDLEVHEPSDEAAHERVARAVTAIVDEVKWATMTSAGTDFTFTEGGTIVRTADGWRDTIRRQDTILRVSGGRRMIDLSGPILQNATELIQRLRGVKAVAPELEQVMWFLGRAHIATSSRDSLLEATIGLESLLVTGPGDSRYRFRLHGAALLSARLPNVDAFRELGEVYDLRSGAAHGGKRGKGSYETLAPRARYLLSQAILATIELFEAGQLRLSEMSGNLGAAVEDLVRRRSTRL